MPKKYRLCFVTCSYPNTHRVKERVERDNGGPFPWLTPEVLDRATRGGGKLEGESEE